MPLAVGLFVEAAIAGRVNDAIRIPSGSSGRKSGCLCCLSGRLDIGDVAVIHSSPATFSGV